MTQEIERLEDEGVRNNNRDSRVIADYHGGSHEIAKRCSKSAKLVRIQCKHQYVAHAKFLASRLRAYRALNRRSEATRSRRQCYLGATSQTTWFARYRRQLSYSARIGAIVVKLDLLREEDATIG
jgi:hypothetical protein